MTEHLKDRLKSLIISRFHQKELESLHINTRNFMQPLPQASKVTLMPFLDPIPIDLKFCLNVIGKTIHSCSVERGFTGYGIEEILEQENLLNIIFQAERLNIELPIFYQLAILCAAMDLFPENNISADSYLFPIALEYGRIAHHLSVLKNIYHITKSDNLYAINHSLLSLFNKEFHTFLKIYKKNSNKLSMQTTDCLNNIDNALLLLDEMEYRIRTSDTLRYSLKNKAIISLSQAASLGLDGLFLRANRSLIDVVPSSNIRYTPTLKRSIQEGGDAYARFLLRVSDIMSSLTYLKSCLTEQNSEALLTPISIQKNFPLHAIKTPWSSCEVLAPEGIIKATFCYSKKENKLLFRLRTPAFYIAQAIPYILANTNIEHIPLHLYSLGIKASEVDK